MIYFRLLFYYIATIEGAQNPPMSPQPIIFFFSVMKTCGGTHKANGSIQPMQLGQDFWQ